MDPSPPNPADQETVDAIKYCDLTEAEPLGHLHNKASSLKIQCQRLAFQ